MSSSTSVKLRYEKCLEVWGNANRPITTAVDLPHNGKQTRTLNKSMFKCFGLDTNTSH